MATTNIHDEFAKLEKSLKESISGIDTTNISTALWDISGQLSAISDIDSKLETLEETLKSFERNNINDNSKKGGISRFFEKGATNNNISDIKNNVRNASRSLTSSNGHLADIKRILKNLEQHITQNTRSNSRNSSTSQSDSLNEGDFSTITSTLKDIYNIIRDFKNAYQNNIAEQTPLTEEQERKKKLDEEELQKQNDLREAKKKLREAKTRAERKNAERDLKKAEDALKDPEREKDRRKRHANSYAEWATPITSTVTGIATGSFKGNDAINLVGDLIKKIPGIGGAIGGTLFSLLKAGFDAYAKQDEYASTYARTIGGGRYGKMQFMQNETGFLSDRANARNGYTLDLYNSAVTDYTNSLGRDASRLSYDNIESAINLKRFGIESQTISDFDTFGKSLSETDKYFSKLYGEVSKKGLSFKNVSKAVNENLKASQKYTFANGVNGLKRMAETSVQLKYNMQQILSIAEKVSTFEGAIETSANLSVLGGDFARFGNPMELMYEALNDPEALNDRIVKMFGSQATWNSKKQQMDLSPFAREQIINASKTLGASPEEMISLALNSGKMKRIESSINKSGLDKDTIEYIKNTATLNEKGEAVIKGFNSDGSDRLVSTLTNEDKEALQKESQSKNITEGQDLGSLWVETKGISDKLNDLLSFLTTKLGVWVAKIAGVNFFDKSQKMYWNSLTQVEKNELAEKYGGSRAAAKAAIGQGHEETAVNEYFGGKNKREFFNKTYKEHTGYGNDYTKKTYRDAIKNGTVEVSPIEEDKGYTSSVMSGNYNRVSNNSKVTNTDNNVSTQPNSNNSLNVQNVSPYSSRQGMPYYAQITPNYTKPIEINVNLTGKYELNGKSIRLEDIDTRDLSRFIKEETMKAFKEMNIRDHMGYIKDAKNC